METEEIVQKRKLGDYDDEPRAKKTKKKLTPKEERMRLEKIVFGSSSYIMDSLNGDFSMDTDSGLEDFDEPSDEELTETPAPSQVMASRCPAWEDEDDKYLPLEEVAEGQGFINHPVTGLSSDDYVGLLRNKFENYYGTPEWAKLGPKSSKVDGDDDDDDMLLRSCGNFLAKKSASSSLLSGIIHCKRLPSLNSQTRNEGPVIKCVEFHPKSTVALVAGMSGVMSLFQVDGKKNPKLASIKFNKFPLRCCKFTPDGSQVMVGSNVDSYFHVYDMNEGRTTKIPLHHLTEVTRMDCFEISPNGKLIAVIGKFGTIHLLTLSSREWIGTLQTNSKVSSLAFNSSGTILYSYGENGEVQVWDMERRVGEHVFQDEGCLKGRSMAVSPCDSLLALGSSHGIVNIYSSSSIRSGKYPTPLKAVQNLVTPVTSLKFNSTSEILAMASYEKPNAMKLVHFPSMTVFKNFPTLDMNYSLVQGISFSPSSGYMSVFNNKSNAYLFRLKHFGNF